MRALRSCVLGLIGREYGASAAARAGAALAGMALRSLVTGIRYEVK